MGPYKGQINCLVSKAAVTRWWESQAQTFGFKRVGEGHFANVKRLRSGRSNGNPSSERLALR